MEIMVQATVSLVASAMGNSLAKRLLLAYLDLKE
jgi:hypothetical protein